MSKTDLKLMELGWELPAPLILPPGVVLPFEMVQLRAGKAYISGHGAQNSDGSLAGPFGRVGDDVSIEDAVLLAHKTALSMLGDLRRTLGDLDRITGWDRVFGMVKGTAEFERHPEVINGFSNVVHSVFGPEIGRHARSAIGVSSLPFNLCVEIEAEVSFI